MAQVLQWSCTSSTGVRETFSTKREMVKTMMGKKEPKTPVRRDGRDYYYQQAK